MKIKNIIRSSTLLFKINMILLLCFFMLVLFNLKVTLEDNKKREFFSTEFLKINQIISDNAIKIYKIIHFYDQESFNKYFKNIKKINIDEIQNTFQKNNINVKIDFLKHSDKTFISFIFNFQNKTFKGSQRAVIFGYLKNIKSSNNLLKRWVYKTTDTKIFWNCPEGDKKNINGTCKNTLHFQWYCVSNKDRYLPDSLKFLAKGNIRSDWVPFTCRW